MNRVKKISRLWEGQRPAVLAQRERDKRRRAARRTKQRLDAAVEERDRAPGT